MADGTAGGSGQMKLAANVGGDDALGRSFLEVRQLAGAQGLSHGGLEERIGAGGAASLVPLGDVDALYAYGGEGASHDMADVPLCCMEEGFR